MTNYLAAAKLLDELLLELLQKGMDIPAHVVDDLKTGRSLANICMRQPDDEAAAKTLATLQNVEMNLLALAEAGFGLETAEAWQRRLNEAYSEEAGQPQASASRFVAGLPKSAHWIRLQADYMASVEEVDIDALLAQFALNTVPQDDGYLLIYGGKEEISAFLKEIREMIRRMGSKQCSN